MDKCSLKVTVNAAVCHENQYEPHRTAQHESRLVFELPDDLDLDVVMVRIGQLFETLREQTEGFKYHNERPKLAEVLYTPEQLPPVQEDDDEDDAAADDGLESEEADAE